MLALPIQGFAGASMLFCGIGASDTAAIVQLESGSNHHQADGSVANHKHAAQAGASQLVKQPPDDQKPWPDAAHKCGVCAACCSVVGIAVFPQTVEVKSSPLADLDEPIVLIRAVPSRLPEKPPRA